MHISPTRKKEHICILARPGTDIILKIERCTNILIKNNKYLNMIYTYMMRTHSQELTTTGRIGLGWVDVFKKVYQHFFCLANAYLLLFAE